jgi:hypothetical protein
MEFQGTMSKTNLKKSKAGEITTPDFKTNYKVIIKQYGTEKQACRPL